jgi:hypothetical protein
VRSAPRIAWRPAGPLHGTIPCSVRTYVSRSAILAAGFKRATSCFVRLGFGTGRVAAVLAAERGFVASGRFATRLIFSRFGAFAGDLGIEMAPVPITMSPAVDDVSIDWSTADVRVSGRDLVLSVRLTVEPGSFWVEEFNRIAQRRMLEVRGARWSARVADSGDVLTVSDLEPGSEDAVRAELDEVAQLASKGAERARQKDEEESRTRRTEAEAREQAAQEMTVRFRPSVGPDDDDAV